MLETGFTGVPGLKEPEDPWADVSAWSCSVWIQMSASVQAVDFLRAFSGFCHHECDDCKLSGQVMGKVKPEREMEDMR